MMREHSLEAGSACGGNRRHVCDAFAFSRVRPAHSEYRGSVYDAFAFSRSRFGLRRKKRGLLQNLQQPFFSCAGKVNPASRECYTRRYSLGIHRAYLRLRGVRMQLPHR